MEAKYNMVVDRDSEPESEIIYKTNEARTVLYKHASCQATSDLSCEVIVPIMFCTMFSPFCEASLQVDLPLRASISVSTNPTSVPSLNIPRKLSERIFNEQSTPSEKKKGQSKTTAIEKRSTKFYRKARHEASPDRMHSGCSEADYESSPSSDGDYMDKDPDNSEFSSDNDIAFWKKVERYTKQKLQASSAFKYPLKYPPQISSLKNDKLNSSSESNQISSKIYESQEATLLREDDTRLGDASDSVTRAGTDDDWITDDEVDEEMENIDMAFKREWNERRLLPHTKEKNFMCEICGKRYSKHYLLRKHVVRDHKEEEGAKLFPYSCPYCKNVYVNKRQLLLHQKQDKGPCETCGAILKCSGLLYMHRDDHECVCQVCNKVFAKKRLLNMHMKVSHREKTVPCLECGKMFPNTTLKNKHSARAHPKEPMPFKCDKCDFHAKKEMAIKIHQKRIHGRDHFQYTCKDCNRKFICEESYNTHVSNHMSRRSIVCHLCSQSFISEEEFQTHMKSIHEAPININNEESTVSGPLYINGDHYSCAVCNITLGDQELLTHHMQQYHYMDIETVRDIKVEVEPVEPPEAGKEAASKVQSVSEDDLNTLKSGRPIKIEPATLKFSTGLNCTDDGSALLMPASVVPPNVHMVDINGVQYHVIRR